MEVDVPFFSSLRVSGDRGDRICSHKFVFPDWVIFRVILAILSVFVPRAMS